MKKRNLTALKLNKKSITNFSHAIKGKGTVIESVCYCTAGTCINTDCEGGVVCDLQTPKGKH